MTTDTTFETVAACVAQLDQRFGNEDADQAHRLREMKLFAVARPADAIAAVARACRRWTRRPTLDELGQLLRDERLGRVDAADFTRPSEVAARVTKLRTLLDRNLEVRSLTESAIVLALRDDAGLHDVHLGAASGVWSCSTCGGSCHHVDELRRVVDL